MTWNQEKMDYLASALCQSTWKYPGMRLDHNGFYEIPGVILDALMQYESGRPYKMPERIFGNRSDTPESVPQFIVTTYYNEVEGADAYQVVAPEYQDEAYAYTIEHYKVTPRVVLHCYKSPMDIDQVEAYAHALLTLCKQVKETMVQP